MRLPLPVDWQSFYTDPQLRGLITQALNNNRDLRLAVLRVEEARAAYGIERARPVPHAWGDGRRHAQRTPGDLNLTGRSVTGSQYQVGLGMAAWELDFWAGCAKLKEIEPRWNSTSPPTPPSAQPLSLISEWPDAISPWRDSMTHGLTRTTIATRAESLRIFAAVSSRIDFQTRP
ncbi:outer membrane oprM domain protein [Bordetella holmesii 30539]|uniref:hypothetical protein n=1 Tax=Bordetella holmesii TaxID=35814 RepID=UPI000450257B|nr:hypothetical protein [Bordetella holmesii]EXF90456.1 outer membrane oprM domain protein [Bordetella holmesii 30539]